MLYLFHTGLLFLLADGSTGEGKSVSPVAADSDVTTEGEDISDLTKIRQEDLENLIKDGKCCLRLDGLVYDVAKLNEVCSKYLLYSALFGQHELCDIFNCLSPCSPCTEMPG